MQIFRRKRSIFCIATILAATSAIAVLATAAASDHRQETFPGGVPAAPAARRGSDTGAEAQLSLTRRAPGNPRAALARRVAAPIHEPVAQLASASSVAEQAARPAKEEPESAPPPGAPPAPAGDPSATGAAPVPASAPAPPKGQEASGGTGGPVSAQGPPALPPAPDPEPIPVPESAPAPEPSSAPEPAPAPEPSSAPEPAPAPEPESAPAPSGSSLVVGIDGGYGNWWGEEIEFRKSLDAAVTRHEWDPSRPVDTQDAFVLAATTEVHTRIAPLLGGNELGDPTHYREWVVAFIRRYGVGGSFWAEHPALDESRYAMRTFELGNEPYFGAMSAAEYADAVRPALEDVKRLGLPAEMILDSYIYGGDTRWIDTLYARIPNLNSLFYGFADHPYWYGHDPAETGDGNSPFTRIETLRRKMAEHGAAAKSIFLTEYGESTADCGSECVSEAVQAAHIREMIEAAANRAEWKVEGLYLYQLHDWATGSPSREQQFGLLRQNGTPKPAYAIAQAAMQQYRG